MGVISNGSNPFSSFVDGVHDDNIAEVESAPQNELDEQQNLLNLANDVRRTSRKIKIRNPVKPMNISQSAKNIGAKKHRRLENALQLMNLVTADDLGEITINDFVPKGVSAFSKLLENRENLKMWHDFINCTEDQQNHILMDVTSGSSADVEKYAEDSLAGNDEDMRAENPAYNPDDCFRRISNRIRALLKRKFPVGTLAQLESEITAFFEEWPRAVYISKLPSSYERLLLHALCQYLDLISNSFDKEGERQTRVKNPKESFQPPSMMLSTYIEQHFKL